MARSLCVGGHTNTGNAYKSPHGSPHNQNHDQTSQNFVRSRGWVALEPRMQSTLDIFDVGRSSATRSPPPHPHRAWRNSNQRTKLMPQAVKKEKDNTRANRRSKCRRAGARVRPKSKSGSCTPFQRMCRVKNVSNSGQHHDTTGLAVAQG